MRLSLEGQMRPIWGGQEAHMTWRARSPDLEAVAAWVDVHIRRPDLNLGMDEFEWTVHYAGTGYRGGGKVPGTALFEGVIERQKTRKMRREARRGRKGGLEEIAEGAELTGRQREALELATRLTTEEGKPDIAAIGREMVPPVDRATARNHLERAQEKVRRHLTPGKGVWYHTRTGGPRVERAPLALIDHEAVKVRNPKAVS